MTALTASVNRRTASGSRRTIRTADLAHRIKISPDRLEALLEESAVDGIVERHRHGWRLTSEGEQLFGRHLRALRPE
jgi:Mn-dependent DtxR family transcriptional regulator